MVKRIAILATTPEGLMGVNNKLPWGKIKGELSQFKRVTTGNIVIMGRKTYDSMGGALQDRINIVVTRNKELLDTRIIKENTEQKESTTIFVSSLLEAYMFAQDSNENNYYPKDIFFIGGPELIKEAIKCRLVDSIYLTIIRADVPQPKPGDECVYFRLNDIPTPFKYGTVERDDSCNEYTRSNIIIIKEEPLNYFPNLDKDWSDWALTDRQAVHELKNWLLGKDWYIVDPVNKIQGNKIIVEEIKKKYKKKKDKKDRFLCRLRDIL